MYIEDDPFVPCAQHAVAYRGSAFGRADEPDDRRHASEREGGCLCLLPAVRSSQAFGEVSQRIQWAARLDGDLSCIGAARHDVLEQKGRNPDRPLQAYRTLLIPARSYGANRDDPAVLVIRTPRPSEARAGRGPANVTARHGR